MHILSKSALGEYIKEENDTVIAWEGLIGRTVSDGRIASQEANPFIYSTPED